jgi:uncharacterized protein YqeY
LPYLEVFLPTPFSADEVDALIVAAIAEIGATLPVIWVK